jgi:hypothetical protein
VFWGQNTVCSATKILLLPGSGGQNTVCSAISCSVLILSCSQGAEHCLQRHQLFNFVITRERGANTVGSGSSCLTLLLPGSAGQNTVCNATSCLTLLLPPTRELGAEHCLAAPSVVEFYNYSPEGEHCLQRHQLFNIDIIMEPGAEHCL